LEIHDNQLGRVFPHDLAGLPRIGGGGDAIAFPVQNFLKHSTNACFVIDRQNVFLHATLASNSSASMDMSNSPRFDPLAFLKAVRTVPLGDIRSQRWGRLA
jgi:hypothetical protein